MKKSDLKTGMRVETGDGQIYLVLKDCETACYGHQEIIFVNETGFLIGENYNENLVHSSEEDDELDCYIYSIVKVYTFNAPRGKMNGDRVPDFTIRGGVTDLSEKFLIWERLAIKEMSKKEIEEALGYKIKIVKK